MRRRIGVRFLGFGAVLAGLCFGPGLAADEADWDLHLGVALSRGERICLATKATVDVGQAIRLISPFEPQTVAAAVIIEIDSEVCHVASESLLPGDYHRLELAGPEALSLPAIAVLDDQLTPRVTDERIGVDLDRDGTDESFRACTSREGLHLTIWSGQPLVGQRRWHQYYYLGYDTESTCDERDYQGSAE